MHVIFYKKALIFLLGFAIGFVAPFSYIFFQPKKWEIGKAPNFVIDEEKNGKHPSTSKPETLLRDWSKIRDYEDWLKSENMQNVKLDMDFYLYAPTSEKEKQVEAILESDWLREKVHLTCVVFVAKVKLAESISRTWGHRCNEMHFFTDRKVTPESTLPIVNFETKFTSSWQYLCLAMNHVWNFSRAAKGQKLEWVIFVKDDTFVVAENLRMILAPLDFDQSHYLGHPIVLWGQTYNVAQAGFVLSKESMRQIVEQFGSDEKCASGGKYWKMEDYFLGKHLEALGIRPSDMRDYKKRGIFHGYSLTTLLWGIAKPGNYWTKALYPSESECCSEILVTFSVGEADKLRTMNYLLYHLHVHERLGAYGNMPAPTTVPEKEVWKIMLKEEFGLNNITDMPSEKYYDLWREKYSVPEEFIARNFKVSTDFSSNQSVN